MLSRDQLPLGFESHSERVAIEMQTGPTDGRTGYTKTPRRAYKFVFYSWFAIFLGEHNRSPRPYQSKKMAPARENITSGSKNGGKGRPISYIVNYDGAMVSQLCQDIGSPSNGTTFGVCCPSWWCIQRMIADIIRAHQYIILCRDRKQSGLILAILLSPPPRVLGQEVTTRDTSSNLFISAISGRNLGGWRRKQKEGRSLQSSPCHKR